jgi:hypothetical protein
MDDKALCQQVEPETWSTLPSEFKADGLEGSHVVPVHEAPTMTVLGLLLGLEDEKLPLSASDESSCHL